jgi:hypothetical protein
VIVNPGSFRMALREQWARIDALARARGVVPKRVSSLPEIDLAVREAVREGAERLILIGGDGTVQAATTTLAEGSLNPDPPRLMILGGGRTNYVARDLGSHRRLVATLEQALDRSETLRSQPRKSLRVQQAGMAPQHGFFLGAALVDDAIRDCQRYRKGRGFWRRGHLSTPLRLAQRGALALAGRSRFDPPAMTVEAAGLGRLDAPIRLLMLTSLQHRGRIVDPYADRGEGSVRLTAVAANARAFRRRLYRLVRGRYHPGMVPRTGYLSGATEQVRIQGLPGISLDGQTFDFDVRKPVEIRPGPEFELLHP